MEHASPHVLRSNSEKKISSALWALSPQDLTRRFPPRETELVVARSSEEHQHQSTQSHQSSKPVEKTGQWIAAWFLYPITGAEFQAAISTTINLVPYLTGTMHRSVSESTKITNNFTGTAHLLSVLGGFVADSYLGSFWTIAGGSVITSLGLGLLTFSAAYSGLQPDQCSPTASTQCPPAGVREMVPLYVALYTIALGTGAVRPNTAAIGADQFDDSIKVEKEQGVRFYVWFYFFTNMGLLTAFTLGVYIQDNVSRGWGYGFSLILYVVAVIIFCLGNVNFRHKPPSGSFLTRLAQVFVAATLKIRIRVPQDTSELYNAALTGSNYLHHTTSCRFLDKAAIISEKDRDDLQACETPTRWRLCSVTQVEESKRILLMMPIWATTAVVSIVFSQISTFTISQGSTLDRRLGDHFTVPSASLNSICVFVTLLIAPIYDGCFVPFIRKYTKHPYGFTTLQRLGASIMFAICTMVMAALVEGRRLKDVRKLHLQNMPLGTFVLPTKMWWLVPQYVVTAMMEFFLFVSQYQFFYHEASDGTRSIASSFTYSASAMGYFLSTVLVDITNRATRNQEGGSWLAGKLNDGGLQKFYWLLAVILACDLLLFLICSHLYEYKYDWYHVERSQRLDSDEESEEGPRPSNVAKAWELQ